MCSGKGQMKECLWDGLEKGGKMQSKKIWRYWERRLTKSCKPLMMMMQSLRQKCRCHDDDSWLVKVFTATEGEGLVADITCGKRKAPTRTGRVVGGENAEKAEFPWLVSLTRRGGHFCGGTIISEKFVLTAGHCLCTGIDQDILQASSIKITVSQYDLTIKNTDAYQVSVKAITIHPGYVCGKPKDDIALLELENTLTWSNSALPACLPSSKSGDDYTSLLAVVAGWGWTNEVTDKGGRADIMQKAKLAIISLDKCREWYKSQGKTTKIKDNHICAGYEHGGVDSCWGDSGGPLMLDMDHSEDQTMVIGVVSTGIGCARPYLPGLYTRISDYISWIEEVVEK
ncbi:trypsin-1 [Diabrotica virgifera virgifera]|uniref:Peptidase S1 domain-containing protein n=1 Tax=Diabrotica virgifera virgifera TaxID=50390 RepID=A0ABM5L0V2_DIAVI|nr:trypsin-1 [Diabrotica virgifera virgifera]